MASRRIFFFIILSCALTYASENEAVIVSNTNDDDDNNSSMRLYITSSYSVRYMIDEDPEDQIGFGMLEGALAIDYHAAKNLIFWTSPKFGFWSKSPKLYSVPWDYDFVCEDEAKDKYCTIQDDGGWYNEEFYDDLMKLYDGHDVKFLREEQQWYPRSLAVDYINDKLYYTDLSDRSISVLTLTGRNKSVIFEESYLIPLEVAIDPPEGLMFTYVANTKTGFMQLYRVNMDGSSKRLLLDEIAKKASFNLRDKLGFALDTTKKRIYYSNLHGETIESIDYVGKERRIVAKTKYPVSLAVYKDNLYWIDANVSSKEVFLCFNKTCTLLKCKVNRDGVCDDSSFETLLIKKNAIGMHNLKLVDPTLQTPVGNPCSKDKPGCQHHCLLRSKDGDSALSYGCSCNVGYSLMNDGKSCLLDKTKQRTYESHYIPDVESFQQIDRSQQESSNKSSIHPIPRDLITKLKYSNTRTVYAHYPYTFVQISEKGRRLQERVIQPRDRMIASKEYNRYLKNMQLSMLGDQDKSKRSGYEKVLRSYRNKTIARPLAYDWLAKNVYYVRLAARGKKYQESSSTGELMVLKLEYPEDEIFDPLDLTVPEISKSLGEFPIPVYMLAHPFRGYVFASLRNGSVVRFNMDGRDRRLLPTVGNASVLAMDFVEDRLFYADNEGYVGKVNLDGTNAKRSFKVMTSVGKPNVMFVHDRFVYVKVPNSKRVVRYDKVTGEEWGDFVMNDDVMFSESVGVEVNVRETRQVTGELLKHPCEHESEFADGGGCKSFCFAVPTADERLVSQSMGLKKLCACEEDNEKALIADGCDTLRLDRRKLAALALKIRNTVG